MHNPSPEQARGSDDVLETQQVADAENDRENQPKYVGQIIISDVDLPLYVADGHCYVQATLEEFSDAIVAAVTQMLSDLETRISEAGSSALSSAAIQRELPGLPMALRVLV